MLLYSNMKTLILLSLVASGQIALAQQERQVTGDADANNTFYIDPARPAFSDTAPDTWGPAPAVKKQAPKETKPLMTKEFVLEADPEAPKIGFGRDVKTCNVTVKKFSDHVTIQILFKAGRGGFSHRQSFDLPLTNGRLNQMRESEDSSILGMGTLHRTYEYKEGVAKDNKITTTFNTNRIVKIDDDLSSVSEVQYDSSRNLGDQKSRKYYATACKKR